MRRSPVSCPYFYGDYHRGNNREECRLLAANPNNDRPWRRKHCDSCPVPGIVRNTNCSDLLLEAEVDQLFLRERVAVTFAVCSKHLIELEEPTDCPECGSELEHILGRQER